MLQPESDLLAGEVRDLRRRVERLEQQMGVSPCDTPGSAAESRPEPEHILSSSAGLLPVLGRALLGLAGAYLLRALVESATLPRGIGVTAGVLYAMLWLF